MERGRSHHAGRRTQLLVLRPIENRTYGLVTLTNTGDPPRARAAARSLWPSLHHRGRFGEPHSDTGGSGWSGSVISAARAACHGARVQPYPTLSDMMAPIARRQRRLRSGGPLQFQSSILTPLRVML
jgi:hypothetical protein